MVNKPANLAHVDIDDPRIDGSVPEQLAGDGEFVPWLDISEGSYAALPDPGRGSDAQNPIAPASLQIDEFAVAKNDLADYEPGSGQSGAGTIDYPGRGGKGGGVRLDLQVLAVANWFRRLGPGPEAPRNGYRRCCGHHQAPRPHSNQPSSGYHRRTPSV